MRPLRLVLIFMALVFILFGLPTDGMTRDSILSCTFTNFAFFAPLETKSPKITGNKDQFTVIFAGLDSTTPTFKGNMGEEKLKILRNVGDAIWLAEEPLLGGINVWTIFFNKKVALMSKQYQVFGSDIIGMMGQGTCK